MRCPLLPLRCLCINLHRSMSACSYQRLSHSVDQLLLWKLDLLAFGLPLPLLPLNHDFSSPNTDLPLKFFDASLHCANLSVEYVVSLLCTHQTGKTSFRPYYACPSLTASKLLNHLRQHRVVTLEFDFPAISNSLLLKCVLQPPSIFYL